MRAASACLWLLRQAKDLRNPAFVVQTVGMHIYSFNARPVSATGQGADASAAAAVAGILKCLPYELPSIRASLVDHDPNASSPPLAGSAGESSKLWSQGASLGARRRGVWACTAVVEAQAATSASDLYGVTAHGGAVAVPHMTYCGTGVSAGVASPLDVTPQGDARNGQHIVTGGRSNLAALLTTERRGPVGIPSRRANKRPQRAVVGV